MKLYSRYNKSIHTVVFCVNKVNKENTKINAGTLSYEVTTVDFSEKNGDDKLKELKEKIENNIEINELELIFLPLMKSNIDKVSLVKQVVNMEMNLKKEDSFKEKLAAITLVMADKLIKREQLEKIWEAQRLIIFVG